MTSSKTLGRALEAHRAGNTALAAAEYGRALEEDPTNADALHLFGLLQDDLGDYAQAADLIRRAISLADDRSPFHHNLGLALRSGGDVKGALAAFETALRLSPKDPTIWTCYGNALKADAAHEAAVAAQQTAVQLAPENAEAWSNLGAAQLAAKDMNAAVIAFDAALGFMPDHPALEHNLGNALLAGGRPSEAEFYLRRALLHDPTHRGAQNDIGIALRTLGRLNEAETAQRTAIEAAPGSAEAHYNLALTLLMRGSFSEGWAHYEHRLRTRTCSVRPTTLPRWTGEAIEGQHIWVRGEQGFGDMIQFSQLLGVLATRSQAEKITLESHAQLVPLLRDHLEPAVHVVERGAPHDADYEVPLMSLPHALRIGVPDGSGGNPTYLHPKASQIRRWASRLAVPKMRIGIAWRGNPEYPQDRSRSIPLDAFRGLAALEGTQLFSLQKGIGAQDLADFPIEHFGADYDESSGAFVDSLAIVSQLDLVICSDSAIAHLAAAAGTKTWLMLPRVPDWRWGLETEGSAWYPTMRLFRQRSAGCWSDGFDVVARRVRRALELSAS